MNLQSIRKVVRWAPVCFLLIASIRPLPGFSQEIALAASYTDALKQARERGSPILVDLVSDWCVECRRVNEELFWNPRFIEASRRLVIVQVDTGRGGSIASRIAPDLTLPMKVLLDPFENILLTVRGITKAGDFVGKINPILREFESLSASYQAVEKDRDDFEALLRIEAFYRKAGLTGQANKLSARAEDAKRKAAGHEGRAEPSSGDSTKIAPRNPLRGFAAPASPVRTTRIVDMSAEELPKKFPEDFEHVEFAANQSELEPLLKRVGENVEKFVSSLPNILAKEHITQARLRPSGKVADRLEQDVDYMLFLSPDPTGGRWKEERSDRKGKPVRLKRLSGVSFITSGYAMHCLLFSPKVRQTSNYRYVGKQSSTPFSHMVAFAQDPDKGALAATFSMSGIKVPMLMEGLAWVDPQSFQITQMRTDLLDPPLQFGVARVTTQTVYGEQRFLSTDLPLWLPKEVVVKVVYAGTTFQTYHRYDDYRLFTVRSFEDMKPALKPTMGPAKSKSK
jgi:thiol-disulfide isomerase/thioredoxin